MAMTRTASELRPNFTAISAFFFSLASLAILAVYTIDMVIIDVNPLKEGAPIFEINYLFRTGLIVLSSWLYMAGLARFYPSSSFLISQNSESKIWENWGTVIWSTDRSLKENSDNLTLMLYKQHCKA